MQAQTSVSQNFVSRARLRKGTFSCWECKHRKRTCDLAIRPTGKCSWCRNNGLDCIGQDHDDPRQFDSARRRLDHVEALVSRLVRQRYSQRRYFSFHIRSLRLVRSTYLPPSPDDILSLNEARNNRCRQLGGYLCSVLPSAAIIDNITHRGRSAFRQHLGMHGGWSDSMKELIHHPRYLLLATRKLYQLVLSLRHIEATEKVLLDPGLDGTPKEMMTRFLDAANHVMYQDFLVQSIQGMEVLMMQAYCRVYLGDVASMCPIFRRALTYGRSLELDKSWDESKESLWFRLVYAERFLALGLGQRSFVIDSGFASDRLLASSKITRRLERIHVLITGRIIDRNLRMQQSMVGMGTLMDSELQETLDLDHQLKQAANCVPLSWWILPSAEIDSEEAMMERISHVLTQMHHHYLLLLLHQPYIMNTTKGLLNDIPGYSKLVAVNASREILTRFAFFKSVSHVPASFVGMAQKAFAASITLLLLHIGDYRLPHYMNLLEHQRPQDLNIIEDNLPFVEEIFTSTPTSTGYGDVHSTRKLLDIEADAAFGTPYSVWMDSDEVDKIDPESVALKIPLPYHGWIYVAQDDSAAFKYVGL